MTTDGWRIRPGSPNDRKLVASFACADVTVSWQIEVERLLAFSTAGDLFGVAAHEQVILQDGRGAEFHATKLEVVAVAQKWQGRSFPTGERASDVLVSAVMTDISARVPPRDARVYAIVHEDNHRSIALCRRHGLTQEMSPPYPGYLRIVTPHKKN